MINLIVALDDNNGLAKDGKIPWKNSIDMRLFKTLTNAKYLKFKDNDLLVDCQKVTNTKDLYDYKVGNKSNNLLIVGRLTAETFNNKLPNRELLILSKNMNLDDYINNTYLEKYDNVWCIGGLEIYNLFINKYRHFCKYLFISKIVGNYNCDKFLSKSFKNPIITYDFNQYISNKNDNLISMSEILSFKLHIYDIHKEHQELQYHNIISCLLNKSERLNRTNVTTLSTFGKQLKFNISSTIPLLTTKKTYWKTALKELLFFVSGKTDTKILEEQGVNIWKKDTSKEELEKRHLDYQEGEMGPMYGFQWRNFNSIGLDQLNEVINSIKKDPYSRRHLLTSYNPCQVKEGVLYPCHGLVIQFYVKDDKLSCHMYQRSGDIFLGVPFNIISYTFLTYMIAYLTNLKANKLIISFGDIHLYTNHIEQSKILLTKEPYTFPSLELINTENIKSIDDFKINNFKVINYKSHDYLYAELNV